MNHHQYLVAVQHRMDERIAKKAFLPELLENKAPGMLPLLAIYLGFPKYDFSYERASDSIFFRPPDAVNLEASLAYFKFRCLCLGDFASGAHAILRLDPTLSIEIWDVDRERNFRKFETLSLEEFVRKLEPPPLKEWLKFGEKGINQEI